MSQARDFVEHVKELEPPAEPARRRFEFSDGSVAEYHPEGWSGEGRATQGQPGDSWIVVADGRPKLVHGEG